MGFFKRFKHGLIESFFRNREAGNPHRNSIGLLLGFVTALLLLASYTGTDERTISEQTAAWMFFVSLLLIILGLIFTRPYKANNPDLFAWGFFAVIVLGFGLGALAFHYRLQIIWLWERYRDINTWSRVILEALFLLGVILGFFVVRNWAKEQKDFVASLTAVLGGAFVASIVGKLGDDGPSLKDSFAAYALGFTLSGTLNLIIAARLTAAYTNRRTIASRAMLDFLYGSERAQIIDGYFLAHFKESPDYAKEWLVETLIRFADFTKIRFADRMDIRRKQRIAQRTKQLRQACKDLEETEEKLTEAQANLQAVTPESPEATSLNNDIARLDATRQQQEALCNTYHQDDHTQCGNGERYYQLLRIENEIKDANNPPAEDADRRYTVLYRSIDAISADMFRLGISVRWQDTLEYIVAPGEYRGSFPLMGSVSGLALLVRKTIVMDRDRYKQFRSKDYPQGIAPERVEQKRGFDEIHFLSYVSVPVVSRLGRVSENAVGILSVDTQIFLATDAELTEDREEREPEIYSSTLSRRSLNNFARRLYEEDDQDIQYLGDVTKIVVPVLELYLKCRVGAT
ncbi:MAG: hypothetical protein V7641_4590 [Blastocatellia bacterium]